MVDQVRIIVGELEQFTERLITRLTAEITANLIETTPVATGWARANWVPSFNSPVYDRRQLTDTERQSALTTQQARQQSGLAQVVAGYDLNRGTIFISNGVPYIVRLNEGSSSQAPAGFVQAAVRRAIATVTAVR